MYDRGALEEYWAAVRPTLADYSARMLSGYRPFDLIEGDDSVAAIVLVEFESLEQARSWYASPAYRKVRERRKGAARFTGLIVDGGVTPAESRKLVEVPRR